MSALTKGLSSLIVVPGLGGAGYLIYEAAKPYPDYVQKIYKAQNNYGGCIFGLANSFQDKTGGFPNQAIGSKLETETTNKLERVHKDIEESEDIKRRCQERSGKILELSGVTNTNNPKGESKNENGTSHSLPK